MWRSTQAANCTLSRAHSFGRSEAILRVIHPDGTFGSSFSIFGDDTSNFFVGGIAYDPVDDRLLVTDNTADGRLYAVSKSGVQQTIAMGIAGIAGIAVRASGEIFVSTSPFGSDGAVLQINRTSGLTTPVLDGLGFGAGLAFDAGNDLVVQDADTTTFQGRLQRLPISDSGGNITFGVPETLLSGMQSSAGVVVADNDIYTTGSGGVFRVSGFPPTETSFDSNGDPSQFATAIAFDPGIQSFEPFSGSDGGRLAYMADFGFASQDSFVTLLTPSEPGDYNADGHVDADDYATWRAAYSTSNLAADGNLDGQVDASDYVLWRAHLMSSAQDLSLAGKSGVPEPATLCVLMVALVWLLGSSRAMRR